MACETVGDTETETQGAEHSVYVLISVRRDFVMSNLFFVDAFHLIFFLNEPRLVACVKTAVFPFMIVLNSGFRPLWLIIP